jgi:hypothetical protein
VSVVDRTKSPIAFVCGHRKSGTTLFRDLLDGHPQLAVYPIDLALLYAYFPEYIRSHPDPADRRARLKRVLFDDLNTRLRDAGAIDKLDTGALEARFFDGLKDDDLGRPGALIACLMAAFRAVRGTDSVRWNVIKETSIEIYAAEILEWFPDARLIQIVRDPRDNFAALAAGVEKHYERLGEDRNHTLASLLHRATLGLRMGRHHQRMLGPNRYHLLRFEDLVRDPDGELHRVAEFLEIDYDPVMMSPTLLGVSTRGNIFEGVAMQGIDSRNVGRWRDRISAEEAQVIEFIMAEEMAAFDYEPAYTPDQQAAAAAEFYKWSNYRYFFSDRFASGAAQ